MKNPTAILAQSALICLLWQGTISSVSADLVTQEEPTVTKRAPGPLPGTEELRQTAYFRENKPVFAVLSKQFTPDDKELRPLITKQLVFFPGKGSEVTVDMPSGIVTTRGTSPLYVSVANELVTVISQDGTYQEWVYFSKDGTLKIVTPDKAPDAETLRRYFEPRVEPPILRQKRD